MACALALAAALSGCSDADSDPVPSATTTTTTTAVASTSTSTSEEPSLRGYVLPRPLIPRCGLGALDKRSVKRANGGWQLMYKLPPHSPQIAGMITILTLDERPSKSVRVHYPKSRIIHVGEIEVDYLRMATIHIAQWVTSRARYVALVDGDLPAVRKLISCTP